MSIMVRYHVVLEKFGRGGGYRKMSKSPKTLLTSKSEMTYIAARYVQSDFTIRFSVKSCPCDIKLGRVAQLKDLGGGPSVWRGGRWSTPLPL